MGELRDKVLRAGFRVELGTSFVSLLLPAMMASRAASRKSSAASEANAELTLPAFINRSFERVMDVERLLIRAGMRFPAGGSLLLIARKPGEAR
jgi:hypothetical protein